MGGLINERKREKGEEWCLYLEEGAAQEGENRDGKLPEEPRLILQESICSYKKP